MTRQGSVERARRHRWLWFAVVGAVLLAAFGAFIALSSSGGVGASAAGASDRGPVAEATGRTAPEPRSEPEPVVTIASTETMAYSPVWNPPDKGDAFWQIVDPEKGYPEDGGTDFIIAHACENRSCTGDEVRLLEQGDTLDYRGETYIVQQKREILKHEIADQDIWEHDPDRIVIITCIIETTWEESDKNDVIVATRARL